MSTFNLPPLNSTNNTASHNRSTISITPFRASSEASLHSLGNSSTITTSNLNAVDDDAFVKSLFKYPTYEDYLDEKITAKDLYYLDNIDLARAIIENEFKRYNILSREQFEEQKKKYMINLTSLSKVPFPNDKKDRLCSFGKDLRNYPLLNELAKREAKVRSGKLNTIIFIRDFDKRGNEISGYIDYGHRLKTEDFEEYFLLKKRLLPRQNDLSFFNWKTQTASYHNSSTFQVIADSDGLSFRHRRDRKVLTIDPKQENNEYSERRVIKTDEYVQVVIYEHRPRRKD
ncbi:hypothetical protein ABK040_015822 [Willaertia magna]